MAFIGLKALTYGARELEPRELIAKNCSGIVSKVVGWAPPNSTCWGLVGGSLPTEIHNL
jgi:hypothetical protein